MSSPSEQELTPELAALEARLATLVPRQLSSGQLDRMAATAADTAGHAAEAAATPDSSGAAAGHGFGELEQHLGQLAPSPMPDDIIERMVKAMDRWHEQVPVEEKVVPFGNQPPTAGKRKKTFGGGMLASAAAVALLGAVTALMFPHFSGESRSPVAAATAGASENITASAVSSRPSVAAPAPAREAWLVPDSLSHNVTNTTSEGVIMAENTPHRCIRVDYVDRVKVQDEDGREIIVRRPGVKYLMLPMETY